MVSTSPGTAMITGASSGIGAVYADRLARRGYDLLLVARGRQRLDALAAHIEREHHVAVDVLAADLLQPEDVRRAEAAIHDDARIAMLVNSAGMGLSAPVLESDIETMQRMITLNVTALTRLSFAAATRFVSRRSGAIINVSSALALAPELLNGAYGATKAFVLALSQALHRELAGSGVRVQVVLPGAVATDFWSKAGTPVEQLPPQIVMSAEDAVDAALVGFDLGEFATLPSLPDTREWNALEAARLALRPHLSLAHAAARYAVPPRAGHRG